MPQNGQLPEESRRTSWCMGHVKSPAEEPARVSPSAADGFLVDFGLSEACGTPYINARSAPWDNHCDAYNAKRRVLQADVALRQVDVAV
ncbi:MAG: hypothetical protein ACI9KE_002206 [Polyangiales bacterium]|jgi:hypothetical protein